MSAATDRDPGSQVARWGEKVRYRFGSSQALHQRSSAPTALASARMAPTNRQ
jgi:hypothetical protein